jgi:2-amino-4-hydroxy-6-hydroxymethyldihydropteridine diphosphokinase
MANIYLALGSNVGDSKDYIGKAIELLGASVRGIKRAPIYSSKAVGYTDQADFLNTAVQGRTNLSSEDLLKFIKNVEEKIGRVERFRFGPREIDIDIIFYDDLVLETEELVIPHPAFRGRDFVLQPLNDLNPELSDPVSSQTVAGLLAAIPPENRSILKQVD